MVIRSDSSQCDESMNPSSGGAVHWSGYGHGLHLCLRNCKHDEGGSGSAATVASSVRSIDVVIFLIAVNLGGEIAVR